MFFLNNSRNIDIWILCKEPNLFRSTFYISVPNLVKNDWEQGDDAQEITAVWFWNVKKTKFRGGHLGFLAPFLNQFWPNLVQFCSLHSIQISIFLELFKKNSFLTIYIHISKGRNSLKNCSIDQIFFSTGSGHSN